LQLNLKQPVSEATLHEYKNHRDKTKKHALFDLTQWIKK
jgi:hypothetical protein